MSCSFLRTRYLKYIAPFFSSKDPQSHQRSLRIFLTCLLQIFLWNFKWISSVSMQKFVGPFFENLFWKLLWELLQPFSYKFLLQFSWAFQQKFSYNFLHNSPELHLAIFLRNSFYYTFKFVYTLRRISHQKFFGHNFAITFGYSWSGK